MRFINVIKYYALPVLGLGNPKFPYKDEKALHMLRTKAAVDTLSEVLGGVAAATMFAIEKSLRSPDNAIDLSGLFNTTAVRTMCATTCIGFSVNAEPFAFAPEADELIPVGKLILTFSIITVFRFFCLGVEIATLNMVLARISGKVHVAPIEGGGDTELPAGEKQEVTNTAPSNTVAEKTADVFTGVFTSVSPIFLFVSFLVALDSVAQGLMIAAWLAIPTSW